MSEGRRHRGMFASGSAAATVAAASGAMAATMGWSAGADRLDSWRRKMRVSAPMRAAIRSLGPGDMPGYEWLEDARRSPRRAMVRGSCRIGVAGCGVGGLRHVAGPDGHTYPAGWGPGPDPNRSPP